MADITSLELETLRQIFQPLIGLKINWLSIPNQALPGFEPSQIAVIVDTLLDAILPQIHYLATDEEDASVVSHNWLYIFSGDIFVGPGQYPHMASILYV